MMFMALTLLTTKYIFFIFNFWSGHSHARAEKGIIMSNSRNTNNNKQPLYNLSSFFRAYLSGNELKGVMISGYIKTDNGTKYANIYVGKNGENLKIRKLPDGSYNITLNMTDCTIIDKDKTDNPTPTPPTPKNKGDLQSFDGEQTPF